MVSIILGVGLSQVFEGIGNLLQIRQRVKSYWLYNLWVLILIIAYVHFWWSFWALRNSVNWNYGLFLYVLAGPAGLVIAGNILIPGEFYEENAQGKFDLRRHYYNTSRLFFGLFSAIIVWAMLLDSVLGVRPFIVGLRFLQAIGLIATTACAFSNNRLLHTLAVCAISALFVITMITRFQAGAFDFPAH